MLPIRPNRRLVFICFLIFLFSKLLLILAIESYFPDDYLWDSDVDFDENSYEDQHYLIAVNSASYDDLRLLNLSDTDIVKIINARERKRIENLDDLERIGIAAEVTRRISGLLVFDSDALSLRQQVRFEHRSCPDDWLSRYYNKGEVLYGNIKVGYASTSDTLGRITNDNVSYYIQYAPDQYMEQLIIGNYRLSLGQGIGYAPAFGFSKGASTVSQPVKNYTSLRPYTSPYHGWSLHGIAAQLKVRSHVVIPFYSYTNLHARLIEGKIRTVYPFGEHRDEYRDSAAETIYGLSWRYKRENNSYGAYISANRFDKEFHLPENNNKYTKTGLFFNHSFDSIDFWGEYARIDNKSGLLAAIRYGDRSFRHLLLYRYYEKDIPTWHGNPFAVGSNFDNENGIYYGMELRANRLIVNAYFDVWRYPGTSYFEKMPVTRNDQLLQFSYQLQENSFRLRVRNKDYDKYRVIDDIGKIRREQSLTMTLEWMRQINTNWRYRSGAQFVDQYISVADDYGKGFLKYEQIRWNNERLTLIAQINVYESEVTHYLYQQTLRGMWENRPLSDDDMYMWIMASYDLKSNLNIQSKLSWFASGRQTNILSQIVYRYN